MRLNYECKELKTFLATLSDGANDIMLNLGHHDNARSIWCESSKTNIEWAIFGENALKSVQFWWLIKMMPNEMKRAHLLWPLDYTQTQLSTSNVLSVEIVIFALNSLKNNLECLSSAYWLISQC